MESTKCDSWTKNESNKLLLMMKFQWLQDWMTILRNTFWRSKNMTHQLKDLGERFRHYHNGKDTWQFALQIQCSYSLGQRRFKQPNDSDFHITSYQGRMKDCDRWSKQCIRGHERKVKSGETKDNAGEDSPSYPKKNMFLLSQTRTYCKRMSQKNETEWGIIEKR